MLRAEREQKAVLEGDRKEQERLLAEAKARLEQLELDKAAAAEKMQVRYALVTAQMRSGFIQSSGKKYVQWFSQINRISLEYLRQWFKFCRLVKKTILCSQFPKVTTAETFIFHLSFKLILNLILILSMFFLYIKKVYMYVL